jgi:FkbM family methyltransferase
MARARQKLTKYRIHYKGQNFVVQSPSVTDMLTRRNWQHGRFYELPLLNYIRAFDLEGVYVDVGANLGNHGIFFANCCKCTKLIAIEAVPEVYHVMADNLAANKPEGVKVEVFNYAAYSAGGHIGLWDPVDYNNIGATRLTIRPRTDTDAYPAKPPRSINTIRIDDLVKNTDHVAVIKMDIQGGEEQALIGACDTIARCNPLLIAEAEKVENREQLDDMFWTVFKYVRLKDVPKKRTFLWWRKEYVERARKPFIPPPTGRESEG